jgi:hypothetical protein
MKRFVDLAGSGAGVTEIHGQVSDSRGIVGSAPDATLRDVTLHGEGTGSVAVGLRGTSERFAVRDATIVAQSTRDAVALYAGTPGSWTLSRVTVRALSGDTGDAFGLYVFGAAVTADGVESSALAIPTRDAAAAYLSGGTLLLRNSRLVATGSYARGLWTTGGTAKVATTEFDALAPVHGNATCAFSWRASTFAALSSTCT